MSSRTISSRLLSYFQTSSQKWRSELFSKSIVPLCPSVSLKMERVTELCGVVISPYLRRVRDCKVVSQAETFTFQ